jgi:hypothetical protein
MLNFFMQTARQHLLSDEIRLAQSFIAHNETELAIEFLCDLFIEHEIIFPEDFGDFVKDMASKFNLSPEKSWRDIIVEEKESHKKYRLYVGKNPLLIRQELESILSEVGHKFDKAEIKEIKEYLEVGEYELALDAMCSILYADKMPISKKCLEKINSALINTGNSKEDWEGMVIEDNSSIA